MGGWAKGAGMGSGSGPGAVPPQFRAGLLDPLESLRPPLPFIFILPIFSVVIKVHSINLPFDNFKDIVQ